ncbi:DUF3054 domain-containing protein [Microbacterium sp. SORGH_AS_0888]|uniref:DUF3054 domain-containing protein n=1 Tax=Microbacterium sp. SORGH_AS_0888 TaxID=3041791 RepID=UPI00277E9BEF|nr:DUF3054 domain-containing protein [Microbacterium sp. SORGH_AS_0888]MDQ1130824.1 hypothetical protein [Microbacterium sp. SORGH_AS_0888]
MTSPDRPTLAARPLATSFATDVVLVVVFAVIGRASHREDVSVGGVALTAWPFLAGLVAGWLVTRGWRAPTAPVRTGIGVWGVTVAGGMLLRAISGQGVQLAFVIVASIVLLLFLVGWRTLAALIRRGARRG